MEKLYGGVDNVMCMLILLTLERVSNVIIIASQKRN